MSRIRLHAPWILVALAARADAQSLTFQAPPENPITAEKAILGKILFWEEQLSHDNTTACGTCHIPSAGGGDARIGASTRHPGRDGLFGTVDDVFGSPGVVRADAADRFEPDALFEFDVQVTPRNTPSAIGAQFFDELFWDGRASGTFVDPVTGRVSIPVGGALESQAVGPPVSDVEMAHEARDWADILVKLASVEPLRLARDLTPDIVTALRANPDYPSLFTAAFGDDEITAERIAWAIATYERTLVPDQTPWDRWVSGDPNALTPKQERGLRVFDSTGNCAICHPAPLFSDEAFHNLGLRPIAEDRGRYEVSGLAADRGTFRTSGLRNVGLRRTFFHNGRTRDLAGVVQLYVEGGGPFPENRDILLSPLQLTQGDRDALVDFLANGLTDPRVANELPPFDRPTLGSERARVPPRIVGTPVPGTGGFAPSMIATSPPSVGSPGFKLGVAQALGGAPAYVVFSAPEVPGATMVRPRAAVQRVPMTLSGQGPGQGFGTLRVPLENRPELAGQTLLARWFVLDPAGPGGVAKSEAAELLLF